MLLGDKSSAAEADSNTADEHISLAPQRSSFLTGCQVKQRSTTSGPDAKQRDGYVTRERFVVGVDMKTSV